MISKITAISKLQTYILSRLIDPPETKQWFIAQTEALYTQHKRLVPLAAGDECETSGKMYRT